MQHINLIKAIIYDFIQSISTLQKVQKVLNKFISEILNSNLIYANVILKIKLNLNNSGFLLSLYHVTVESGHQFLHKLN